MILVYKMCCSKKNVRFIFRIQSNEARLQALKLVVNKLPQAHFDNLRYLIKFFSELSRNQEVNKMTPQNIAIVIAPNLIWSQVDETAAMGWAYYMHLHWLLDFKRKFSLSNFLFCVYYKQSCVFGG